MEVDSLEKPDHPLTCLFAGVWGAISSPSGFHRHILPRANTHFTDPVGIEQLKRVCLFDQSKRPYVSLGSQSFFEIGLVGSASDRLCPMIASPTCGKI
jgi:hypothetical protein